MPTAKKFLLTLGAFFLVAGFSSVAMGAADIVINNIDSAGQGFNDNTSASPVGGNPGTTVGAQRLNVFFKAAEIWGDTLDSPIQIVVQSTFQDRGFTPCTASSGVLGAAGTIQLFANDPSFHWPNTWYFSALGNKLAGVDLGPGDGNNKDNGFLVPPFGDDIIAFFNPNLGTANCLATSAWYYGLDNNAPAGQIDLLNVLLHELGHGLGFANQVDEDGSAPPQPDKPGSMPLGIPDVYMAFTHDNDTGKQWNQMNNLERARSAINVGDVVWNGPHVNAEASSVLSNEVNLEITSGPLDGTEIAPTGAAAWAAATPANFNDNVIFVNDGSTATIPPGGVGTIRDGCQAPTNSVAGAIAMVDRGSCTFATKAAIAQAAGADGILVVNNVAGDQVIGMSGTGPTIPGLMISLEDGALLKNNLPLSVGLVENPNQLAGADEDGHVLLFSPNPVQPGSSISHWDTSAIPNLLMEPFINSDLEGATTLDLTPSLLFDIGWDGDPHCPDSSIDTATIVIGSCNSGVSNDEGPFVVLPSPQSESLVEGQFVAGGCTLADTFNACSSSLRNRGDFRACIGHVAQGHFLQGNLSLAERDAIVACAP